MNPDDIKRALEAKRRFEESGGAEALEKRKQIEDSGVDLTRIQDSANLVNQTQLQAIPRNINLEALQAVVKMLRQPIPREWIESKKNIDESLRIFAERFGEIRDTLNIATKALEPIVPFLQKIHEANQRLESIKIKVDGKNPFAILAANTINTYRLNTDIITRRFEGEKLQGVNETLATHLVLPSIKYADFSWRTIERITESENTEERSALGSSIIVAQEELQQSTGFIENTTIDGSQADELFVIEGIEPFFNVYDEVQLDLLNVKSLPEEATYPVLLRFSSAATLARLTRKVLNSLLRCNKTAHLKNKPEIFKPTPQSMEAMVMLSGIIVRNEEALRDFIIRLYGLIYEGAGDKNLRFLKDQGGYLEPTECDVIWNLKALRNKWLSHDPEHGKEKDIRSSFRSLDEALGRLGFERFPRDPREFETLQSRILEGLYEFFQLIEDRIASETDRTSTH